MRSAFNSAFAMISLLLSSCSSSFGVPYRVSWETLEEAKSLMLQTRDGDHPRMIYLPNAAFLGNEFQEKELLLSATGGLKKLPMDQIGPFEMGYPVLSYSVDGTFLGHSVRLSVSSFGLSSEAAYDVLAFLWSKTVSTYVEGNRCTVKIVAPNQGDLAAQFEISIDRNGKELSEDEVRDESVFIASRCLAEGDAIL